MKEEEEERAMPCQGPKASELFGKTAADKNIVGNDPKENCKNIERHLDSLSGIENGANAAKNILSNPFPIQSLSKTPAKVRKNVNRDVTKYSRSNKAELALRGQCPGA